jgi:hypothetical protein
MVLSLRKATGWVLLLAGAAFFFQLVQLLSGATAGFGLGVFSFAFGGGAAAALETAVATVACLGVGTWLTRGD